MKPFTQFVCAALLFVSAAAFAQKELTPEMKRLRSINSAKILAERSIVETVYGVNVSFLEEITDMDAGALFGVTETNTDAKQIKGILFATKYDPKTDIAQVTAELDLSKISDLTGKDAHKQGMIRRVAFASSTRESRKKLAALRGAELDAYKNLYKQVKGFTLESKSKLENFMLTSDKVRASVIGSLLGAEMTSFSWEGTGDNATASVVLTLNVRNLEKVIGQKLAGVTDDIIQVTGRAAPSDFQKNQVKKVKKARTLSIQTEPEVVDGPLNIL